MLRFIAVLALLGLAQAAQAAPSPELENFLDREISRIDTAISPSGPELAAEQADVGESWFLRNFFLRIKPYAGFTIPGLLKVQVTPEAELLFQRVIPEGWAIYKPRG